MVIKKEKNKTATLIIFGIFLIGIASAATVCCERTLSGQWCQNVNIPNGADPSTACNVNTNPITGEPYRAVFAFCDATSYCNLGTCVNNQEGTCMPNSPQIRCESEGGFWSDKPKNQLPQCSLGCCIMGSQAAFVTQVSCNRLSSLYGLPIEYRSDIGNEINCLASANPTNEGACVYTKDFVKTCERTTKKQCQEKAKSSLLGDITFHEGYLCSANELETICAKSQQTICQGDDIYFIDTCGNIANVYDSSKIDGGSDDENYWTLIQEPVCNDGDGNKNSRSCGNCDYLEGSMCRQIKAGETIDYGNNICGDLDCLDYSGPYSGTGNPKHGESWCATDSGTTDNNVGDVYYRMVCYNGEVTTEICDTTRQKICAEEVIGTTAGGEDFFAGNCKINLWQDCTSQNISSACEDETKRDCVWQESKYEFSEQGMVKGGEIGGICVPKYSPGFSRDGTNNIIGGESCNQASAICYVKVERKPFGITEWDCDNAFASNNCSCLEGSDGKDDRGKSWANEMNQYCIQLGDCGVKDNFLGKEGQTPDDVINIEELEQ